MSQPQPSTAGSITVLLQKIRSGEQDAIQPLFDYYFSRLATLAGTCLPNRFRRVTDGEDLAVEVLASFFQAAGSGGLPELRSREDIWRLLAKRLRQRAANEVRNQSTQKEGDGRVRGESVFLAAPGESGTGGLEACSDPRMDRLLQELHSELLERLDDALLKEIATLLLEGHSIDEIAVMLHRSRATIYRKLDLIREAWLSSRSEAITSGSLSDSADRKSG